MLRCKHHFWLRFFVKRTGTVGTVPEVGLMDSWMNGFVGVLSSMRPFSRTRITMGTSRLFPMCLSRDWVVNCPPIKAEREDRSILLAFHASDCRVVIYEKWRG